jgi:heptosyltransferase-2
MLPETRNQNPGLNREERGTKRILVVRPGAMGDILVASPLLPNLRRAFPESYIAFLVDKKFNEVLRGNPYIDEFIEFDREHIARSRGLKRIMMEIAFLRRIRAERFDTVFDLLGSLRTAILSVASGAKERVGYTYRVRKLFYNRRVLARNPQYVVDYNLDSLRRLGITICDKDIYLPSSESDASFADEWLSSKGIDNKRPVVGLFPGGGWESKRWPLEHFSRLGDMLASDLKARVLVMGGPQERDSVRRIASSMSQEQNEVLDISLSRFAALVSRLDLFVSNDSGPRYLAVAAGVPSIGLFGPTDAVNANPPLPIHRAVTYGGDCLVCNRLTCRDQTCMRELAPEMVFEVARTLLGHRGRLK